MLLQTIKDKDELIQIYRPIGVPQITQEIKVTVKTINPN